MNSNTCFFRFVFGAALGLSLSAALAQEGATVLFSQSGVRIVDAAGSARPAQKGERLQAGERLVTPPNGISQLKLPDGSLLGVRPDSELIINRGPKPEAGAQHLALTQGAVRVVGAELVKGQPGSSITLQTPHASVDLRGADFEAAVVKGGPGGRPQGEPGSYNRLTAGSAVMHRPAGSEPMPLQQTSFVGNNGVRVAMNQPMPLPGGQPRSPAGGEPGLDRQNRAAPGDRPQGPGPANQPQMMQPKSTPMAGNQPGIRPMPPGPGPVQMAGLPPLNAMQPRGAGNMPMQGNMPGAGPMPRPPGLMPRPPVICTPNPVAGNPPICR